MKGRTLVLSLAGLLLVASALLVGAPFLMWPPSVQTVARPPLCRDLPADLRDGETAFKARVAEAFPLGSSEAALRRRLGEEGFRQAGATHPSSTSPVHLASFSEQGLVCVLKWRVSWQAEADRLVSVSGEYDAICL